MADLLFTGARVVDPTTGMDEVTDVRVAGGQIEAVGNALDAAGAERIDGEGLILAPGLVDLHTHLREPGFEHKETIETGTRAAATGGYTAVFSMANTDPVTDHAAIVAEVKEKAAAAGLADVFPVGAITKDWPGSRSPRWGRWSRRASACSATTATACRPPARCATRSPTRRPSPWTS